MRQKAHSTVLMVAALVAATTGAAQQPFDLDAGFGTNIQEEYISSVLPLANGSVLISGRMVFNGDDPFTPRYGARLNSTGARDPSFTPYPTMGGVLKPWGNKFYSGGQEVMRLNMNGTTDGSFGPMYESPYFGSLQGGDYHVFPDGRVLMSGAHVLSDTARGFEGLYNLIWFTNTGYLDTARTHRRSNGTMVEFEAMLDGKFICSTQGTTYEGQPITKLFRVDSTGALDAVFSTPIDTWGWCQVIRPLSDGRILTGGTYRLATTTDTLCLFRLLPEGSLDPEFHIAEFKNTSLASTSPYVNDILVMPDSRMVVTGNFDLIDGEPRRGIALLNSDGTLSDDAFVDAGCGVFNYEPFGAGNGIYPQRRISGIVPAPDGSYYIHGSYWGYDDGSTEHPTQRFVSRLHGLSVGIREQEQCAFKLSPNPASGVINLDLDKLPVDGELVLRDAPGREMMRRRLTSHYTTLELGTLNAGVYLVELFSEGKRIGAQRLVVE